jgi:hypothetical protein
MPKKTERFIVNGLLILNLFCCLAVAVAQPGTLQSQADKQWAARTGLTVSQVAKLRQLSDITDGETESVIHLLDRKSLKSHNQVLLVGTGGSGSCLDLNVFSENKGEFKKIWQQSETPDGAGFCKDVDTRTPVVMIPNKDIIAVRVFLPNDQKSNKTRAALTTYYYRWNGETYEYSKREKCCTR